MAREMDVDQITRSSLVYDCGNAGAYILQRGPLTFVLARLLGVDFMVDTRFQDRRVNVFSAFKMLL